MPGTLYVCISFPTPTDSHVHVTGKLLIRASPLMLLMTQVVVPDTLTPQVARATGRSPVAMSSILLQDAV